MNAHPITLHADHRLVIFKCSAQASKTCFPLFYSFVYISLNKCVNSNSIVTNSINRSKILKQYVLRKYDCPFQKISNNQWALRKLTAEPKACDTRSVIGWRHWDSIALKNNVLQLLCLVVLWCISLVCDISMTRWSAECRQLHWILPFTSSLGRARLLTNSRLLFFSDVCYFNMILLNNSWINNFNWYYRCTACTPIMINMMHDNF